MVISAFLVLATVSASAGAVLGLLPTWRTANARRERLAIAAYRALGLRGDLKFPIYEWPPTAARTNLIGLDGFRPGNFVDDPRWPENQALRHSIGRPEDVDKIGWVAAAKLT